MKNKFFLIGNQVMTVKNSNIEQKVQPKKKEVKEILSKKDLTLDYKINDGFKEINDNLNEEFLKLEKNI